MKRIKTSAQAEVKIDAFNAEVAELRRQVCEAHAKADALRGTDEAWRIPSVRAEAESFGNRIGYRERMLLALKEKLAELRTGELIDNGYETKKERRKRISLQEQPEGGDSDAGPAGFTR